MTTNHYLLYCPGASSVVVVVMVTSQDLSHFLVAPDDAEEAASIRTPEKAIWRTEGGTTVTGKLKPPLRWRRTLPRALSGSHAFEEAKLQAHILELEAQARLHSNYKLKSTI